MSRNTVSLTEFADLDAEINGVNIRSNIPFEPYVPTDEITVDIGRIATAAKLGKLSSLKLNRYSEQDAFTPNVVGIGNDGGALASFSTHSTKAKRSKIDQTTEGNSLFSEVDSTIDINFGHDDLTDINLRDPKPWANFLDTSVRNGISAASSKRLLKFPARRIMFGAICLGLPVVDALNSGNPSSGAASYAEYMKSYAMLSLIAQAVYGESEITTTPGLMLDRISAQQLYSRTGNFVQVAK